jgi:hypothetical protein
MVSDTPFAKVQPPRSEAGCWPTAAHTLLLQAAVADPGQGGAAWREWNLSMDIEQDQIDIGSYRLLPLVYKNLMRKRGDGPKAKILESLYKRTWYENQVRFRVCADVLKALHGAGIETLLLKGCPLSILHYQDLAARPMSDIDLLVPKHSAFRAIQVLADLGWSADGDLPMSEAILDLVPGRSFVNADGIQLDLHCHVLHFGLAEATTRRFWEASVPLKVNDVMTRTLCPADQLLHVCAHGLMWNEVPPVRWIADAMMIIGSAGETLDWDRLLAIAPDCNAGLQLHEALSYLRSEFNADIPERVIEGLEKSVSTRAQRGLFATLTHGGRWRGARVLWYGFVLSERYARSSHNPRAFLEYLRIVLGKEDSRQVLQWAARRTWSRIQAYFSASSPGASAFRRRSRAALSMWT